MKTPLSPVLCFLLALSGCDFDRTASKQKVDEMPSKGNYSLASSSDGAFVIDRVSGKVWRYKSSSSIFIQVPKVAEETLLMRLPSGEAKQISLDQVKDYVRKGATVEKDQGPTDDDIINALDKVPLTEDVMIDVSLAGFPPGHVLLSRLKDFFAKYPTATVKMRTPTGATKDVTADQVDHYKSLGAVFVQFATSGAKSTTNWANYPMTATEPGGRRIGSRDGGVTWYDLRTGENVK